MRGAGDTVRSIIISANSRLAFLENKQVLRLLSKDELNLSDIGIGVNGDVEDKRAGEDAGRGSGTPSDSDAIPLESDDTELNRDCLLYTSLL